MTRILALCRGGIAGGGAGRNQRRPYRRDGAGHLVEQRRVAAKRRELGLPQIEITLGQLGEVGRLRHACLQPPGFDR